MVTGTKLHEIPVRTELYTIVIPFIQYSSQCHHFPSRHFEYRIFRYKCLGVILELLRGGGHLMKNLMFVCLLYSPTRLLVTPELKIHLGSWKFTS